MKLDFQIFLNLGSCISVRLSAGKEGFFTMEDSFDIFVIFCKLCNQTKFTINMDN